MERTGWRRALRNPRVLVVLVLVLLAILVGSVVLSLAAFTTSSKNASSISAGDLVFDVPSAAFVDTSGLRPGDTRTGTMQIANRKSAATFTLGFAGLDPNPLRDVLQLTIDQSAPVSRRLYSGPLKDVKPIVLGRIETGASIRLGFTFVWPSDQRGAQLQGQTVPLVLQWDATT
jgi:hypothetical protein